MKNIAILGVVLITLGVLSFYSIIWTQETASIQKEPQSKPASIMLREDLNGSIFEQRAKSNIVKFALLPSFRVPLILTLDMNSREFLIETLTHVNGFPSEEKTSVKRTISEPELRAVIEKTKEFLREPTKKEKLPGLDGSTWVIELTLNGEYFAAHEWSPQDGKLRELAVLLSEIADRSVALY